MFHIILYIPFQIFYFINASMLNHLLLRKDMCHWSTNEVSIVYNKSCLVHNYIYNDM